eukprot:RCo011445
MSSGGGGGGGGSENGDGVGLSEAQRLKQEGNTAHHSGDYRHAVGCFSRALELHSSAGPTEKRAERAILLSNRSASYCLLGDYGRALDDAEAVLALRPEWAKGYSRKAAALQHLERYPEAIAAFRRGLELEPT